MIGGDIPIGMISEPCAGNFGRSENLPDIGRGEGKCLFGIVGFEGVELTDDDIANLSNVLGR